MKLFTPDSPEPGRVARRRTVLFLSAFMLTSLATWFMADLLWSGDGINGLEWALLTLFVILFSHIAIGFVTAMLGFSRLTRGGDTRRIENTVDWEKESLPLASTAIVMPVFNEDVSRVFEGLRGGLRSLEETGSFATSTFSYSRTPTNLTSGLRRRLPGWSFASKWVDLVGFSIESGDSRSIRRRGMSPTFSGAGERSTGIWWCWMPTR